MLNYVSTIIKKFFKCRVNFRSVTNAKNKFAVLALVNVDPYQAIRRLSNKLNISINSVHTILKKNKFYSYRLYH